ncbi:MAG TPA: DUF2332 domain-containing protein [Nocardioidaceae bacterium]|nr:DUF2332 domain-containing protein [Nocardioidaceae bacterium]
MSLSRVAGHFRQQSGACGRLGSPMYAELLDRLADDIEAGGAAAKVLEGHEDDPGPSGLALRLVGTVHRLVLDRRAGELATCYPSVGGTWDLGTAWPLVRGLLREHCKEIRDGLERAPQTNEIGRAGALMGGLLRIGETYRLPLRLREIGSSGGLNLNADRFAYEVGGEVVHGPADSPVRLADCWQGRPPQPWPDLAIVERLGSDLAPVDVATTEGRLGLTSYVWPDQTARLERLRSAFEVAGAHPVEVRRSDAVSFARDIGLREGATTVLWHSVMWQYLSTADQEAVTARIEELGAAASARSPFAHLAAEPARRTPEAEHEFLVVLRLWPGGERQVIGTTVGHGIPTTWE